MASANKFVDDMARMMTGAAGVAQGAFSEAENTMKSWTQKWVGQQGFVSRDEFEAVAEMAKRARAENEALRKELDELCSEIAKKPASSSKAKK